MSPYTIKPLDRSYNVEMLNILRSAPNSTDSLTVCFDRQPDFFVLPEIRYSPYFYYGFFDQNHLKGFGAIGYHDSMVNGKASTVFHLRDYYVAPEARGKGFGYRVTENFFKQPYKNSEVGYSVIMAGNKPSLHYVGRRNTKFPYIPYSRMISRLDVRNIMLTWPVLNSRGYMIRKADNNDIPEIVTLLNNEHRDRLFGNIYDVTTFGDYLDKRPGLEISDYYLAFDKAGKACGVCAAWDCSSFRQTRVLRYGRSFRGARILYKGLSMVFNLSPLPLQGDCFRDAIITDYATRDRDPGIMNALLRSIYNELRKRGFQNMMWGSSADDPLLKASQTFFYQRVVSNIILVSTNPAMMENGKIDIHLPFIDIPCL